ncbi:MAG: TRAP transporter large permease subunit [Spirochaetales bacterium]
MSDPTQSTTSQVRRNNTQSPDGVRGFAWRVESILAILAVLLLALMPLLESLVRLFFAGGVPGYNSYLVHLVLLIAFFGGMVTARENEHLAVRVGVDLLPERARQTAHVIVVFVTVTVVTAFAWASLSFVIISFVPGARVGFIPLRVIVSILPIAFLVLAVRFAARSSFLAWLPGALLGTLVSIGSIYNVALYLTPAELPLLDSAFGVWLGVMPWLSPLLIVLVLGATFFGMPLFAVLGGVALLLFARFGGNIEIVANESYEGLTGSTVWAAIPLFTVVGFLLSESRAGQRLVRLFRALFGWLPGGLFIAAVIASAFFTTFTGASGVTIVALGGLLILVLVRDRSRDERFSVGLLTAGGSLGLLFPPSLALIVYGSVAGVSIRDLFLGGLLPGLAMVVAVSIAGVVFARRRSIPSVPFRLGEAWQAFRESIFEILLPGLIVALYFGGIATLTETAAYALIYILFVEVVIKRELSIRSVGKVLLRALTMIGGVLLILALARALYYYIVDAQIPMLLASWVEANIQSRLVFLLLVNLVLLVAGMFMDIFGAIQVVAPLLIPTAALFGIDPIHLGVIFVANMGIGFITPPVGINLFLAAYRFELPLTRVYRAVVPFFLIQFAIVLLVTYWPWLSTGLLP